MEKPKEGISSKDERQKQLPSSADKIVGSRLGEFQFNMRHLFALVAVCGVVLAPLSCIIDQVRRDIRYKHRAQKLEADLAVLDPDHYLHAAMDIESHVLDRVFSPPSLILDRISDAELQDLFKKNPEASERICAIWIEYSAELSSESYERIATLPSLRHLMLSNAEELPLSSLEPLRNAPRLRTLYAQHAKFSEEDVRATIPGLGKFSTIRYHFPHGIEYYNDLQAKYGKDRGGGLGDSGQYRELLDYYEPKWNRGFDMMYDQKREQRLFEMFDGNK